ncbi:MAG: hypothetical protein Q9226_008615 [Calogaya cf. arnoldii]
MSATAMEQPPVYTTSNGCPVPKPEGSLNIGGGPLLLQDFHLIDLLAHFNRERIPERAVHAKGAGAYGEFEVTHDISDICSIDMLNTVGKKTACVSRFSTSGGEKGSADSARDPRGFATKFYTDEGNWDWVYNNAPFFFLRDPAKFPAFVHSQKRDPQTNLKDATMYWDYITNNPESIGMVVWLFSEYGTVKSYRHMNAYMGHTHKWVKPDGSFKYIQMYLQTDQGYQFNTDEQAQNLAGTNGDHATQDLFEAIEKGDYPTWTAYVQVLDPLDAETYRYDIFDITTHWPLEDMPARPFGKLTLNRNPDNHFAEIEQLAFSPSHLVPGIEPSADPVLQARMFSYPDAQRHRLGVNYQQIPVNRPKQAFNPLQRDGAGAVQGNGGAFPSHLSSTRPMTYKDRSSLVTPSHEQWSGSVTAKPRWQPSDIDFDSPDSPRGFWDMIGEKDKYAGWQGKMIGNIARHLSGARVDVRTKAYVLFRRVHDDLGDGVERETEALAVAKERVDI